MMIGLPAKRVSLARLAFRMSWVLLLAAMAGSQLAHAEDQPPKRSSSSVAGREPINEPDSAPHQGVKRYEIGQGPRSYLLFEPDKPRPEPESKAPVVVFLHGWFAVNPGCYGAWIDHLCRNGSIVIFPRYQNDIGTMPQEFLPNALAAIRDALAVLHGGVGHVRPDLARFALIGHSAGANLAAQIAAVAADPDVEIPIPQALVTVMPGVVIPTRVPSLSNIPATTLLTVIVGDEDFLVGDLRGRQIFAEATAIPRSRKRFILFRSDRHGYPPLVAEHASPTGSNSRLDNGEGILHSFQLSLGEVNAFDRAGFWHMADLTLLAGFNGKTLDDVTRDKAAFCHLGYWSDGRPVTPPIVGDDLSTIPRVIPANGLRIFAWSGMPKADVALGTGSTRR